jgi:polyphosphate glucokinase
VAETVREVAAKFGAPDRVGVTFPGVVVRGVTKTAANVDKSWIDADAAGIFTEAIGRPVTVLNDADAAGVAEMRFGAGRGVTGTVLMLTFGTGIGTALFVDGTLVPNTELGHLEIDGHDAETQAAASVKDKLGISYEKYAHRLQRYYEVVEKLFWPDLIIIGGGVSKDSKKFLHLLKLDTEIIPAQLLNQAGIVGAAWLAMDKVDHPDLLL